MRVRYLGLLAKDFFSPFVARKAKSGTFVGLGKNADAAVHYAANTGDPAVISTVEWAVGIADVAVDEGKASENVCRVELVPFSRENANLTYFRAPNIERDCREEDELFGPEAHAARNRGD